MAAFEELVGSHGGMGGPQNRPFLLHPAELTLERAARGRAGRPPAAAALGVGSWTCRRPSPTPSHSRRRSSEAKGPRRWWPPGWLGVGASSCCWPSPSCWPRWAARRRRRTSTLGVAPLLVPLVLGGLGLSRSWPASASGAASAGRGWPPSSSAPSTSCRCCSGWRGKGSPGSSAFGAVGGHRLAGALLVPDAAPRGRGLRSEAPQAGTLEGERPTGENASGRAAAQAARRTSATDALDYRPTPT